MGEKWYRTKAYTILVGKFEGNVTFETLGVEGNIKIDLTERG
jgi:hypothetical protein